MNPHEIVPLQGEKMWHPNAGQATSPVQYTSVNISPEQEMPKDHFIWSLFNFVHYNPFCLGLFALIHSIKARDRKMVGDVEGAKRHGATARTLNIISSVITCLLVVILLIVFVCVWSQIQSFTNDYLNKQRSQNNRYYYNG